MKQPALSDELDIVKLAEVALGLLALTIHDGARAWKGMDWGVMNLLFERGWIHDPRGQAKSVVLTEKGLERSHGRAGDGNASCRGLLPSSQYA